MTNRKRYHGIIAPVVHKVKTFQGYPSNDFEKYQLDEADVTAMLHKLKGKPMCYNHDRKDEVGSIAASYRDPVSGSWDVEYEIDPATEKGRDAIQWIEEGKLHGLSLQHLWSAREPLEVSLCWKGAREGSKTTGRVVDGKLLHFDSNSGAYKRSVDPDNPIAVAAADFDTPSDDICDVSILVVMASTTAAAPTPASPTAAAPAPASPSPPPAQQPSDAEMKDGGGEQPAAAGAPAAAAPKAYTYEDVQNLLKFNNGIYNKEERAAIREFAGQTELNLLKEKARADELAAKVQAFEAEQKRVRDEAEAKTREAEDRVRQSATKKVGDFLSTFQDDPAAIKVAEPILASLTAEQAALFANLADTVKASFDSRRETETQTERAIREWKARPSSHQQQQSSATTPDLPVAASSTANMSSSYTPWFGAPAAGDAVAASSATPNPFDGSPIEAPINMGGGEMSIAASFTPNGRALNEDMEGRKLTPLGRRLVQEQHAAQNNGAGWRKGAGLNWNWGGVVKASLRPAFVKLHNSTTLGDGVDGDTVSLANIASGVFIKQVRASRNTAMAAAGGGGGMSAFGSLYAMED